MSNVFFFFVFFLVYTIVTKYVVRILTPPFVGADGKLVHGLPSHDGNVKTPVLHTAAVEGESLYPVLQPLRAQEVPFATTFPVVQSPVLAIAGNKSVVNVQAFVQLACVRTP